MNDRCACPACNCQVNDDTWVVDGRRYCCEACQRAHPPGMEGCRHEGCDCGARLRNATDAAT